MQRYCDHQCNRLNPPLAPPPGQTGLKNQNSLQCDSLQRKHFQENHTERKKIKIWIKVYKENLIKMTRIASVLKADGTKFKANISIIQVKINKRTKKHRCMTRVHLTY